MWAKFDDKLIRSRKVRRVARKEPAAALLWMFAIIYCCEQQTDGEIEADELADLIPSYHEEYARLLVKERLMHDAPGCDSPDCLASQGLPRAGLFVVHDFAEWQMVAEEWVERQEKAAASAVFANHKRWHVRRGVIKDDCLHCAKSTAD